jgi:alkanesulfonate monooxygenase SsuD/methylene tetrahydromethanopterin reductase-like flavin-dependent oxidoreductase (luciferase family)
MVSRFATSSDFVATTHTSICHPHKREPCIGDGGSVWATRVGTGGVAVPDWNPLRLAEDIAVLDIASGGRFDCGVMKGASRRTNKQLFHQHDDPSATQRIFAEVLDILVQSWKDEPFSHKGEFYQFPVPGFKETNELLNGDPRYYAADGEYIAMTVHPKPLQKPHPPMYMLGDSVASHEFAAERGMPVMCYTPSDSTIETNWRAYREAYRKSQGVELAPAKTCQL